MSKIEISNENVKAIVKSLQTEHDNISTYITELNKELTNIESAWEGADATKYISKMRDDYAILLKLYNESYQTYLDFLDGVYDEYKKKDDEYKGKTIEV